jgi:hypothetical protein
MSNTPNLLRIARRACTTAMLGVVASAVSAMAQPAIDPQAQQPIKTVMELYTSQGCSSCPRADALMESTFSKRPGVLALSFSVDYWDYIGWKDTNGSPLYSARQRDYARARGDGAVYTPQMVVSGRAHAVGSQAAEIDRAIQKIATQSSNEWVALTVKPVPTGYLVDAQSIEKLSQQDTRLLLVGIKRRHDVKIDRGENTGRSITYTNVVKRLSTITNGTTASNGPISSWSIATSQLADAASDAHAVILQRGIGGPIIGAAKIGVW